MNATCIDLEADKLFNEMLSAIKKGDHEVAHSREDDFRERCFILISEGHPNSIELAKWALSTKKLGFSRWCA